MFDNFRLRLAAAIVGYHPTAARVHFHLWEKKDYPNLYDRAMYSGKQVLLTELDEMSCKRRKSMWDKTPVSNYHTLLQLIFNGGATASITDTGAASRTVIGGSTISASTVMNLLALSADSTFGVVVGSNATAYSRGDTKLNTQINHGTTATTLNHGTTSVNAVTNPSGNITRIPIQRSVTGNASSTANIQEDALYAACRDTGNANRLFCIARNVNSFGAVAASQVVTITRNWDSPTS